MQPDWLSAPFSWILEWIHQEQSLIAGLLALAGAWLTVRQIRSQIETQERRWAIEQLRRERAVRARLPLALSEVIDYCDRAYDICRQVFERHSFFASGQSAIPLTSLPAQALETIATAVQEIDNHAVTERLVAILRRIQVVHSRLRSSIETVSSSEKVGGVNDQNAFAQRAFDIEVLRRLVETLFDYARGRSDSPKKFLTKEEAASSFDFGTMDYEDEFRMEVRKNISAYWSEKLAIESFEAPVGTG